LKADVRKMNDFINSIQQSNIVCIAALGDALHGLSKEDENIFERIGTDRIYMEGFNGVTGL